MDKRLQQNYGQRENILNKGGQQRLGAQQSDGQIHSQSQNQILQRRIPSVNNNSAQTGDQQQSLDELNDLIRIQKKRQENYLQLLETYRKKNTIPGQMQIVPKEWIILFSQVRIQEIERIQEENRLVRQFIGVKIEDPRQKMFVTRFCMRVCEIYEQGNLKLKSLSLFDSQREKLAKQFLEKVHKLLKSDILELEPILVNLIRSFIKNINEELEHAKQLMTSKNSIIMMGEEVDETGVEDCLLLPLPNHPDLQEVCKSIIEEDDFIVQNSISVNSTNNNNNNFNIVQQNNVVEDLTKQLVYQNTRVGQDIQSSMKQQKSIFNFYDKKFFKLYDVLILDKPFIKQQISSLRVGNQDKFLIELIQKNSQIQSSLKSYIESANTYTKINAQNLTSQSSPNLLQPQTFVSPKKRSKNHQNYINKLLSTCFFGFEQNSAPSKNKIKSYVIKSEKTLQHQIVSLSRIPYSINIIPSSNDLSIYQNDPVTPQNNLNPSSLTNLNPPNNSITSQNNLISSEGNLSPVSKETIAQMQSKQTQKQQYQSTNQIQNKNSANNIGQQQTKYQLQIKLYSTDCIQQSIQCGGNTMTSNTRGVSPIKQENEIVYSEQSINKQNNFNQQNQDNKLYLENKQLQNYGNIKNIILGQQTLIALPQSNYNSALGIRLSHSSDNRLGECQITSNLLSCNQKNQLSSSKNNQQQLIHTSSQFTPYRNQISKEQQTQINDGNIILSQTSCNGFVQSNLQQYSITQTSRKIQDRSSPPKDKKSFSKEFNSSIKSGSIIQEAQKQVQNGLSNLLGVETKIIQNNTNNRSQNNNDNEVQVNNSNQISINKNAIQSQSNEGTGSTRVLSPIQQRNQQYQKANNILNNKQQNKNNSNDSFQNTLPKLSDTIQLAIKSSPLSQPQTNELYPTLYNLSKTICEDELEEDSQIRKINYINTEYKDNQGFSRNKRTPGNDYQQLKDTKIKEQDKQQNIVLSDINRGQNKLNTSSEKQSPLKSRKIFRKQSQDKSSLNTPVKCVQQSNKCDFSSEIKTIYDASQSINQTCKRSTEKRINTSVDCVLKNTSEIKIKQMSLEKQMNQQSVQDKIKINSPNLIENQIEVREGQRIQGGSPQMIQNINFVEKIVQEVGMKGLCQTQVIPMNQNDIAGNGEELKNQDNLKDQSIQQISNIQSKANQNNLCNENLNIQEQKQNILEKKSSSSSSSSTNCNGNQKQNQNSQQNRIIHINPIGNYIFKKQQNNYSRGKSTQERVSSTHSSQQNNSYNQLQQNSQSSQKHHQSNSYSSSSKKSQKIDQDENQNENIDKKDHVLQKIQNSTQFNKELDSFSKDSKQFIGNNSKDQQKNSNNTQVIQQNSPYFQYSTQYVLSQEDEFDKSLNQFKMSHNTLAISSNKKNINYRNNPIYSQYRQSFHNIINNNNSTSQNLNNSQNYNINNSSNQNTNNQSLNYSNNYILNNLYNNNNLNASNNLNNSFNNDYNINPTIKNGSVQAQFSRAKSSHENNTYSSFSQNQCNQQLPFQINFKQKSQNQQTAQQKNILTAMPNNLVTVNSSNKDQRKEGNVIYNNPNKINQGDAFSNSIFNTVAIASTNTGFNGQTNQSKDRKEQNVIKNIEDDEQNNKTNQMKLHSIFQKTQFKEIMDNYHIIQNVNQQQVDKYSSYQQPQNTQNIFQKTTLNQNQIMKTTNGEKNILGYPINPNQYNPNPYIMNGQNSEDLNNSSLSNKRSNNFMKQSDSKKKEINLPKIFNPNQTASCPFTDANYNTNKEIYKSPNKQND